MKLRNILLLLPMLSACAGTPQMLSEIKPVQQSVFTLSDDRPDSNKHTRVERVGHNLVRYILGDDRIKPTIPSMLETYLYDNSKHNLLNKTISVTLTDIRIYQLTGSNKSLVEKQAYIPPSTSPGAVMGGIFISDLLDMGFTEKRIEVELEGMVGNKKIKAVKYDYYTFGSPENKAFQMLNMAMQEFAAQIN